MAPVVSERGFAWFLPTAIPHRAGFGLTVVTAERESETLQFTLGTLKSVANPSIKANNQYLIYVAKG